MAKHTTPRAFTSLAGPALTALVGAALALPIPLIAAPAAAHEPPALLLAALAPALFAALALAALAARPRAPRGPSPALVARAIGLPTGATYGLALALALALTAAHFLTLFVTTLLPRLGYLALAPDNLRIAGSLALAGTAAAALALPVLPRRAPLPVLAVLAAGLAALFAGPPPAAAPLPPSPRDLLAWAPALLAALPAFAGLTLGLELTSGRPASRRALRLALLTALAVGVATHLALAAHLGPAPAPLDRPDLAAAPSAAPDLLLAAVLAGALFAALALLLGAARVLQAAARDGLLPAALARGAGRHDAPRAALLAVTAAAGVALLAADPPGLAMAAAAALLAAYVTLGLGHTLASGLGRDGAPRGRALGALTLLTSLAAAAALAVAAPVTLAVAAGATLMAHALLERRALALEAGDPWRGLWTVLVRAGLRRLDHAARHRPDWRPNLLIFSERDAPERAPLLGFAASLLGDRGVATDVELVAPSPAAPGAVPPPPTRALLPGAFARPTPTADPGATMAALARYHGFSGVEPNAVLLDWPTHRHAPDRLATLGAATAERDLHLLLLGRAPAPLTADGRRRVDLWFGADGAHLALGLALARLLARAPEGPQTQLRFLVAGPDPAAVDRLLRATRRLVDEDGLAATALPVTLPDPSSPLDERIRQLSHDADLVVLGLDDPAAPPGAPAPAALPLRLERLDPLLASISGGVLLVRAARRLEERFRALADATLPAARRLPRAHGASASAADLLAPLVPPEPATLDAEARRFAARLEQAFAEVHTRHLAPLHDPHRELIARVAEVVSKAMTQLGRALEGDGHAKPRKSLARAQTLLLFQAQRALDAFDEAELPAQAALFAGAVARWREVAGAIAAETPLSLRVLRAPEDFEPEPGDPGPLARLKWRRRVGAALRRGVPRYRVAPRALLPHWLELRAAAEVEAILSHCAAMSARVGLELGRVVMALADHLSALEARAAAVGAPSAAELGEAAQDEFAQTLAELDALRVALDGDATQDLRQLSRAGRDIAQGYADDLDRLDVASHARRERRVPFAARQRVARLEQAAARWESNQRLALARATLPLRVAAQHRRLRAIGDKWSAALAQRVRDEVEAPLEALGRSLVAFREAVGRGIVPSLGLDHDLKPRFDAARAVDALERECQAPPRELPERVEVVANAGLGALAERPLERVEAVAVELSRLVGIIVESELVGDLQRAVAAVPEAERQALRVAQDVVRLVTWSASELAGGAGELGAGAQEQLLPLIDGGLARVEAERARVRGVAVELAARVEARLAHVRERTDVFALAGDQDPLDRYARSLRQRARQALGAARRGVSKAVRRAVVGLVYRQSRGVLLARRLAPAVRPVEAVVGRALALVEASSPRPGVLDALPFYYRQLFLGRATSDSAFWVGREGELAQAAAAIAAQRRGVGGAVVVLGAPGAGKSAFVQQVLRGAGPGREVHRVVPPAGGSPDVERFGAAVVAALRGSSGPEEALRTLGPDAVVVFEDAELWWERSEAGFAAITALLGWVDRWGDRVLFVVEMNTATFRAIQRFTDLAGRALAVIECGPVDARTLEAIIEARHRSTGLSVEVDGRPLAALGEVRRARLFAARFDDAHGLVGPALSGWIASITEVRGDTLAMSPSAAPDVGVLDDLPMAAQALLVQLALHRALTLERLERLYSAVAPEDLAAEVAALVRGGLVARDAAGVLTLDRFVRHRVLRRLEAKGMLP